MFTLITEAAPEGNQEELLSVYTDIGVEPRKDLEAKGNKATTTDSYWIVKEGDIIINKLLMWMGAVGLSKYNGVTSPAYDVIRAKEDALPEYYHYLLRSPIMRGQYLTRSRGIMEMRLRLYFEDFCTVMLPVPPLAEQAEIVAYIEAETGRADGLIRRTEREMALMREYRTALVAEAVTGK